MLALSIVAAVPAAYGQGRSAEPVRIGLLLPYTGVYAQLGQNITEGVRLAVKEAGEQVAGRPIVIIQEDTEGRPTTGRTKARKLVELDQVHAIIGPVSSGVGTAIRDLIIGYNMPQIYAIPGTLEESGTPRSANIFRVSFSPPQIGVASAHYAYNVLGYRRLVVMGPDYVWGERVTQAFRDAFEALGGQVTQMIMPPLGTLDYAPFLTQVRTDEADGMWVFFAGSDAIAFVTQYADFGLADTFPLIAAGDLVDDDLLEPQGDAARGIINFLPYAATVDNPANERFVAAYEAEYGRSPSFFAELGYVAAQTIMRAAEAVGGDVENKARFIAEIQQVQFDAPRGPFRFDAAGFPIETMYVRRVDKQNGKLLNIILDKLGPYDSAGRPVQ